jgi:hypothetical protein
MLVRQGVEVKATAGAQGYRNAVIIMRVSVDKFSFTRYFIALESINILVNVGHIPLAALPAVAMGCCA